jgi:transcriptional regulator with XRE-family HTH domain
MDMDEIGHTLLEAREKLGLTLEEVERATRIRTHHLEALEKGMMDALPSPVQARGFLNNYAEFLGLDARSILNQYAEKLHSQRARFWTGQAYLEPGTQPSVQVRSRRSRWLSSDLLVAAGITFTILLTLIWGGSRVVAGLRSGTSATQDEVEALLPTSTTSPTISPVPAGTIQETEIPLQIEATSIPTQPLLLNLTDPLNIMVAAEKRAWIQVLVDGEETFRGRVQSGDVLEFQADEVVEIVTGNGAGIRIFYNGQDQGLMGEVGQVVIRLWTLEGVLTPTATITRTPTRTPRISDTPVPSPTAPSTPGG